MGEKGRQQRENFPLAPWASRRRSDLLQLLDRLNPTIAELTQVIEQEVEKYPAAQPAKGNVIYVVGDVHKQIGVVMEETDQFTVLKALGAAEGVNPNGRPAHCQGRQETRKWSHRNPS